MSATSGWRHSITLTLPFARDTRILLPVFDQSEEAMLSDVTLRLDNICGGIKFDENNTLVLETTHFIQLLLAWKHHSKRLVQYRFPWEAAEAVERGGLFEEE